jgi:hypothetical protein
MVDTTNNQADTSAEQFTDVRVELYCEDETNGIMFDVSHDEESNIFLFTLSNPNTTEVDTEEGKVELHNTYATLELTKEEALEASKALKLLSDLYDRMNDL